MMIVIQIQQLQPISSYIIIQGMKKFEQELKEKAHLNKIKNAKKTVPVNKNAGRSSIKNDEAQVLISLYDKKRFDSIPAYKLLRTAGLQQYTRGFIQRGYGVNLGILTSLSQKDKNKLYEDIKVLPGHAAKLDKLIQTISKHSYIQNEDQMSCNSSNIQKNSCNQSAGSFRAENQSSNNSRNPKAQQKSSIDVTRLKFNDPQYEKQLQRVINEYTPNTNEKNNNKKANVFKDDSGGSSSRSGKPHEKITINFSKLKIQDKEFQAEKNLEKVVNQFTPIGDQKDKKKRTFNQRILEKRTPNMNSGEQARKYSKTKYVPNTKAQPQAADFRKKNSAISAAIENKPTMKRSQNLKGKQPPSSASTDVSKKLKNMNLGLQQIETSSTSKIMEINLQLQKIKSLNRSFDGAVMSSTVANIDIQELVFAFSGFVFSCVSAAPEPTWVRDETPQITNDAQEYKCDLEESIQDEVGNILRESYLHPLYRQDQLIDQNIDAGEVGIVQNEPEDLVQSEGQEQEYKPQNQFLEVHQGQKLKQSSVSSFLGGQSYQFGLDQPLQIFNEPQPTDLDYFKPTVDSIANFIKNIVLTAKMQREIPIMAAHYLQSFINNSGIIFTSLNYKRILVTLLLLASKIWDDQSFQSPSFSKTFPEYTTVLLNQMQKQVLKALDYKLKLGKKEYAQIYFKLRKYARKNLRSCQNKKLNLQRIRQLQTGVRRDYRSNFMDKRNSF